MKPEEKTTTNVGENLKIKKNENNSVQTGWKQVVIGGVSGILMGVGGTLAGTTAAEAAENVAPADAPAVDEGNAPAAATYEVPVASSVNNNMSFGEAFAAARAEVGAGGVFEWNGRVYNTFYAEEWNSMSPAEHSAFQSSVTHVATPVASAATAMETNEAVYTTESTGTTEAVAVTVAEEQETSSEARIIGVYEDTIDGQDVYVGAMEVEGNNIMLVDIEHDGVFDVAVADVDDNGAIGEGEIVDISGENISVEDFAARAAMEQQNDVLAANDMPDYMNDADVSMC